MDKYLYSDKEFNFFYENINTHLGADYTESKFDSARRLIYSHAYRRLDLQWLAWLFRAAQRARSAYDERGGEGGLAPAESAVYVNLRTRFESILVHARGVWPDDQIKAAIATGLPDDYQPPRSAAILDRLARDAEGRLCIPGRQLDGYAVPPCTAAAKRKSVNARQRNLTAATRRG